MLFVNIEDEEKQQRLRTEVMKSVGTLSGNDPERAETAEQNVKKILRQRADRNSSEDIHRALFEEPPQPELSKS